MNEKNRDVLTDKIREVFEALPAERQRWVFHFVSFLNGISDTQRKKVLMALVDDDMET